MAYGLKASSCHPLTYVGTVKRHNICKRHVSNDTGFKQTERAIFLHVIPMG